MNQENSKIFSKPDHVAKLSAQLSKQIKSKNKKNNLDNLAKINRLAKLTAKTKNPAYAAAVDRSAKFPIDELQRRVLGKLKSKYSEEAYKDLVINLDHIPIFDKLNWLKEMDDKLRNERK